MSGEFDYFVILAGMRTGSNFLEASLNEYDTIRCWGELFNPHFIGHADTRQLLGMSMADREARPLELIERMRVESPGIGGFRFFHDHDPRVLSHVLNDRRCAKIVLTRNPLESYVSHEIVKQTGQWRLGDLKHARSAQMKFDALAFENHLTVQAGYYRRVLRALQKTGQTPFYIDYEDIGEAEVLNGLAAYLGQPSRNRAASKATKKQNPQPMREKIANFEEAEKALKDADLFGLARLPSFEPRRGPAVPGYLAADGAGVLFMPVRGAAFDSVLDWLGELDGTDRARLVTGFTQKSLRKWRRSRGKVCSFTIVSHPVERLYRSFARHILPSAPEPYAEIADKLKRSYGLGLNPGATAGELRADLVAFANFVRGNLNGQTGIRIDGAWASQTEVIRGMGQLMFPDHIFREDTLAEDLDYLAAKQGRKPPALGPEPPVAPFGLRDVYDDELEAAVRAAYQRDYLYFGFRRWGAGAPSGGA